MLLRRATASAGTAAARRGLAVGRRGKDRDEDDAYSPAERRRRRRRQLDRESGYASQVQRQQLAEEWPVEKDLPEEVLELRKLKSKSPVEWIESSERYVKDSVGDAAAGVAANAKAAAAALSAKSVQEFALHLDRIKPPKVSAIDPKNVTQTLEAFLKKRVG